VPLVGNVCDDDFTLNCTDDSAGFIEGDPHAVLGRRQVGRTLGPDITGMPVISGPRSCTLAEVIRLHQTRIDSRTSPSKIYPCTFYPTWQHDVFLKKATCQLSYASCSVQLKHVSMLSCGRPFDDFAPYNELLSYGENRFFDKLASDSWT
jgi:hypothetical protein